MKPERVHARVGKDEHRKASSLYRICWNLHDSHVYTVAHAGMAAAVIVRAATADLKTVHAVICSEGRVGMPLHQDCHTSWLPLSARLRVLRATCVWRRPAMPRAARVVELPLA